MFNYRRLYIKIILLIKSYNKEKNSLRIKSRIIRREEIKKNKKTLFEDLHTGILLKELTLNEIDLDILYSNPSYEQLINLVKYYRGFSIGDHPSIYRKSVNKNDFQNLPII